MPWVDGAAKGALQQAAGTDTAHACVPAVAADEDEDEDDADAGCASGLCWEEQRGDQESGTAAGEPGPACHGSEHRQGSWGGYSIEPVGRLQKDTSHLCLPICHASPLADYARATVRTHLHLLFSAGLAGTVHQHMRCHSAGAALLLQGFAQQRGVQLAQQRGVQLCEYCRTERCSDDHSAAQCLRPGCHQLVAWVWLQQSAVLAAAVGQTAAAADPGAEGTKVAEAPEVACQGTAAPVQPAAGPSILPTCQHHCLGSRTA